MGSHADSHPINFKTNSKKLIHKPTRVYEKKSKSLEYLQAKIKCFYAMIINYKIQGNQDQLEIDLTKIITEPKFSKSTLSDNLRFSKMSSCHAGLGSYRTQD